MQEQGTDIFGKRKQKGLPDALFHWILKKKMALLQLFMIGKSIF